MGGGVSGGPGHQGRDLASTGDRAGVVGSSSRLAGVGWGPQLWSVGMGCPCPGPGPLEISFCTPKPILEQGYFSISRCLLQVEGSFISWALLIKHSKNFI